MTACAKSRIICFLVAVVSCNCTGVSYAQPEQAALTASASEPLENVQQLGPVKVTVKLSPKAPVIGDEVQLEIRVEAAPKVEVLMPEFGDALNQYSIVNFVPRQSIANDGSATYTQTYTLQPFVSGPQSIPPILIEFVDNRPGEKPTPDDFDAYEILTERIDFEVQSMLAEVAGQELAPPLGELSLDFARERSSWTLPILLALGLVAISVLAWWRYRAKKGKAVQDPYEAARQQIEALLQESRAGAMLSERFFVKISTIVRTYLEERFELRAPELTTEEFLELISSGDTLSSSHQALLRDFLRQADLVKFAGAEAGTAERDRSTSLALSFLDETREPHAKAFTTRGNKHAREVVNA